MNPIRPYLVLMLLLSSCTPTPTAQAPVEPEASRELATSSPGLATADAPLTSLSSTELTTAAAPSASAAPSTLGAASTSDASAGTTASIGSHPPTPSTAPDTLVASPNGTGPATGGPRSNRPCEFHESVDAYNRVCVTRKNPDGSLHVEAKGTRLNPDNGFEFTMHGGPYNFFAHGTLNAFGICAGPFTAQVSTVIDKGLTTYELRFKQHCKIVIR